MYVYYKIPGQLYMYVYYNMYIPYSKKFLGNSVIQGKRKLLKNPE